MVTFSSSVIYIFVSTRNALSISVWIRTLNEIPRRDETSWKWKIVFIREISTTILSITLSILGKSPLITKVYFLRQYAHELHVKDWKSQNWYPIPLLEDRVFSCEYATLYGGVAPGKKSGSARNGIVSLNVSPNVSQCNYDNNGKEIERQDGHWAARRRRRSFPHYDFSVKAAMLVGLFKSTGKEFQTLSSNIMKNFFFKLTKSLTLWLPSKAISLVQLPSLGREKI